MRREVLAEDLQRLYRSTDMVKTDCGGCKGCAQCCNEMGHSITLDPYDYDQMAKGLQIAPGLLTEKCVEWNVVDGLVLPNLRMEGEWETCVFLDEQERCSIHDFRPGICRLFPMGRYYENGGFQYFLQSRECPKPNKTKVRISRWLNIPDLKQYETFVCSWHYLLEDMRELLTSAEDEQLRKDLNRYMLEQCYLVPYTDFYPEAEERMRRIRRLMEKIL